MKAPTLALVASAAVLGFVAGASSTTTVWTAALSSRQEVPPQVVKDANTHGQLKGTLTGTRLTWRLTFAKLSGFATGAHIHMAARGKSGAIVVPLCGPCTRGQTGTATLTSEDLAAFKKHLPYVNVHTAENPAGEIRGQLAIG